MSPRSRYSLVLLLLIVAGTCVALGFWQLDRLHQRRAANAAALAARRLAPVDLNAPAGPADTLLTNRRVMAAGEYDHAHDLILRGQAHDGEPGVAIVTPLRLTGRDSAVLVERGFVRSPDAFTADPDTLREPEPQRVIGLAFVIPAEGGQPIRRNGRLTFRRLDRAALDSTLPYPVLPIYVLQSPDSSLPEAPQRLEPPALDNGPHLNYAIQWFAFATTALVFAGVFLFRRDRTDG